MILPPSYVNFRAKIALNAVICMILLIFSSLMELFLLRKVGFYRSFLQFYDDQLELLCIRASAFCSQSRHYFDTIDAN